MSSTYSNTSSQSPGDGFYFVPGYGISRHIIFSHIHFYLGPYAAVRPYSYQGREGYLVTAGRTLTRVSTSPPQLLRVVLLTWHRARSMISGTSRNNTNSRRRREWSLGAVVRRIATSTAPSKYSSDGDTFRTRAEDINSTLLPCTPHHYTATSQRSMLVLRVVLRNST